MVQISEFRPNPNGSDPSNEPFEISGTPGSFFNGVLVFIEGDDAGGLINNTVTVSGTFDSNGLLVVDTGDVENPSFTVVLASAFTGSGRLDDNEDGSIDDPSVFGTVYDAIGIPDGATGNFLFGSDLGGADFAFTGDEPRLIFRTANGDLFAVNDPDNNEVIDINGNSVDPSVFVPNDPLVESFGATNPECFVTGTLIAAENGEIAVEELKVSDRVKTAQGALVAIKWIGIQEIDPKQPLHPFRSLPIQIKAGALGENLPKRDLFVSPDHALLVDGLLINAGALENGSSIIATQPTESFTYYHIELENHSLLIAEGTYAESFLPQNQARDSFDNGDEYEALYPNHNILSLLPMSFPRVSSKRQLPRCVAKRLAKVAETLPGVEEKAEVAKAAVA